MDLNPSSTSGRTHLVISLLLVWVALLLLMPRLASAHGGGTPRLTDVVAGPYRVFAWTQPEPLRVGDVHVTIGLTLDREAAAGPVTDLLTQPVTDATVTMRFVAVDERSAAVERVAVLGGVGAVYYEVDASLPTAGPWRFMIEVRGSDDEGRAEFTEEVLAARTVNWTLLAAGGVVFVLLIALIGLWNRRQEPTSRQASLVNGRTL